MKLDQLQKYGVVPAGARAPARERAGSSDGPLVEELIAGALRERGSGACFVVSNSYGQAYSHGLQKPVDLARVDAQQLSLICRDPELAYLDLSRAVFLDTETTGLGTGAGTYVFLVGAGYLEGGEFKVRQFFLRGPGDETAFLDELQGFLARFSSMVSFNGKAFDWPLLENRFLFHRRRPPWVDPLHLDLLHPARRLWKRRLESCRLASLEARILSVERSGEDVPGYIIPSLYFEYQVTGDGRPLQGVFYHNLQDVLSLAALTIHIERVVGDPHGGLVGDGPDFLSLAWVYEKAGLGDMALACYEEALLRDMRREDRLDCLLRLAGLQKRERRWDAVLPLWDRLLDEGGQHAALARVEFAKYYEHVERDYVQAINHVQRALELAELHGGRWPELDRRELEHRLSRLVNRAFRARSWAHTPG